MPIYQYKDEAGHEWEEYQSLKVTEPVLCPECGQVGRKIVPSGVSAHFRGAGWTPKFFPNREGK